MKVKYDAYNRNLEINLPRKNNCQKYQSYIIENKTKIKMILNYLNKVKVKKKQK